jgi:hypothetical protein
MRTKTSAGAGHPLDRPARNRPAKPLWEPEKATSGGAVFWFKHLGVFDDQSSLIADVPIPPLGDSAFHRAAVWDYAHSRVFLYSRNKTLTEFDYGKQTVRRFPLSTTGLKVP